MRTIGGPITAAGLGALLGDTPQHARDHARPHDLALADARDHVRRAVAALRSLDAGCLPGDAWAAVARSAAVLRDVTDDLDRVARRQPTTPYE